MKCKTSEAKYATWLCKYLKSMSSKAILKNQWTEHLLGKLVINPAQEGAETVNMLSKSSVA